MEKIGHHFHPKKAFEYQNAVSKAELVKKYKIQVPDDKIGEWNLFQSFKCNSKFNRTINWKYCQDFIFRLNFFEVSKSVIFL